MSNSNLGLVKPIPTLEEVSGIIKLPPLTSNTPNGLVVPIPILPSGVIIKVLSFPLTPIIIFPFTSLFLIIKSWFLSFFNITPLVFSASVNLISTSLFEFLWRCNKLEGSIIPPMPTLEFLSTTKVKLLEL